MWILSLRIVSHDLIIDYQKYLRAILRLLINNRGIVLEAPQFILLALVVQAHVRPQIVALRLVVIRALLALMRLISVIDVGLANHDNEVH